MQRAKPAGPTKSKEGTTSRRGFRTWAGLTAILALGAVVAPAGVTGAATGKSSAGTAVTSTIFGEITNIPAAAYDAVGTGATAGVTGPTVQSGSATLKFTGKPAVLYIGGEFCPFCAAERWAIIASLSRFGTFQHLKTMTSSASDVDPSTPTFSFHGSTYTSSYLTAKLVELYGQTSPAQPQAKQISKLTSKEGALFAEGDPTSSIPFVDFGGAVVQLGASYTPQLLHGQTRSQIAAALHSPTAATTKAILGTSNYFSAAICQMDGAQPTDVCTSAGVKAAAKALHLST